jgi:hypothetical protein
MKLTDDQKVQIFCAALNGVVQVQAETAFKTDARVTAGPVEIASSLAVEAIATLQSKAWD